MLYTIIRIDIGNSSSSCSCCFLNKSNMHAHTHIHTHTHGMQMRMCMCMSGIQLLNHMAELRYRELMCLESFRVVLFTVALFRYFDFFGLLFFMSPCIVNSMPSPMATSSCVCSLMPFLMRPSARISSCPNSISLSPCSADIQRQTPLPFVSEYRISFRFVIHI